jgi:replicative DNA helicase
VARTNSGQTVPGQTVPGERGSGTQVSGRVLPQDLEVEKAVLSALLLDNQAVHSVLTEISPDDFYHPAHQQLFRAMLALQDDNQPVDLHTLSDYLNTRKLLDALGGPVFLAEIADYEATAANVVQHARIVRDKSIKRGLIGVATEIVESGFDQSDRAEQLLDAAESKIFEISQAKSRVTFTSLHDEMDDALNYVEGLMERGGELTGVASGFKDFDEKTGGLQPGELIVIAARPSMGKRAWTSRASAAALDR